MGLSRSEGWATSLASWIQSISDSSLGKVWSILDWS